MISAKEARQLVPDDNDIIKKELEYVNERISVAARSGLSSIELIFPTSSIRDSLKYALNNLGYIATNYTNKGLEVSW